MPAETDSPQQANVGSNLWILILLFVALFFLHSVWSEVQRIEKIPYSDFLSMLEHKQIAEVSVGRREIVGKFVSPRDGSSGFTVVPVDPQVANLLAKYHVTFRGLSEDNLLQNILSWLVPMLVFFGIWIFLMNRAEKHVTSSGGILGIGQSKARMYVEERPKVSFNDVAGMDEAKQELNEVVSFLAEPQRYRKLGGRLLKGVLLIGPPGCGKTLLARAVAGEAGVPFFSISGSEFVEMFVGVGAARVRDLFEQAQKRAPCIIFIDELDALGRARGVSPLVGGHDEKEQTLNQLLVELDGFDPRQGVMILAATNRPEILDPALLRAGRFDRQVLVDKPDRKDRVEILKLHMKNVVAADNIDVEQLAGMTTGFTGADLANLVNEAALLAARQGAERIAMSDFYEGIERIVAGLERKNRLLNPQERKVVAYHETGHALVALAVPSSDPVHKISIISRGIAALGYTMQRPTEDRYLMSRQELFDKITVLLGGRAAEMIVFGDISTGAADDLSRATDIARSMITRYGMEDKLGPVVYELEPTLAGQKALGFPLDGRRFSEQTAREIDLAVKGLVDTAVNRASAIVRQNRDSLERVATKLLEKETLTREELLQLVGKVRMPVRNDNRNARAS